MSSRTRAGPYTFAEFMELVREDQKADLLEGNIYMASPESTEHNKLVWWLGTVVGVFAEERRLGRVTINRVAFRLAPQVAPEPDVAFVDASRSHLVKGGYVDGPPDLAIEVVSPDSVERDYEQKRAVYEEAGVREYWIVDPDEQRFTVLLNEQGVFTARELNTGSVESIVLAGLRIDVDWLWERPLRSALMTVQQMLGQR